MRNISFALTTEQVRNRTKTVTRRVGWHALKPGTLLQPVVKGMGLGKGGKVEKIGGPIRVVSVRRESLSELLKNSEYAWAEIEREGFPADSDSPKRFPSAFVNFFCASHKVPYETEFGTGKLRYRTCEPTDEVTRIEFEYLP